MTISGDYATPVYVNGFQCKNCTDVDNAKKNIDPAHPKAGPFGIDAAQDPGANQDAAVKFGGQLSKLAPVASSSQTSSDNYGSDAGSGAPPPPKSSIPGQGGLLDLSI